MAKAPRVKMQISDRAKQFAPFSALNGLDEALAQKRHELELVSKRIIIDYDAEIINDTLNKIKNGMQLSVTHYLNGIYATTSGSLTDFNRIKRTIRIDDFLISIDNISNIKINDNYLN